MLVFTSDYVVSSPLIALYYTQIVGDARKLPTLRAASNFTGMAVIGEFSGPRNCRRTNCNILLQMRIRTFPMAGVLNTMVRVLFLKVKWYPLPFRFPVNQNNFFRSVRNIHINLRSVPAQSTSAVGLHWQVSQATSLYNVVVDMSTEQGNKHQGMFMENGSGGFMGGEWLLY